MMVIALLMITYLVIWVVLLAIAQGRYLYLQSRNGSKVLEKYPAIFRSALVALIELGRLYEHERQGSIIEQLTRVEHYGQGLQSVFRVNYGGLPQRCEVCHLTDKFDVETGICSRCLHTTR
ncbi:MAG: hypothetical protein RMM17_09610 [Acidobacteriota bacterium]|nr:hypothetical protein [Blastocatellia bacterium]MDW8412924.1 hypothetical protein [Acidobacteriota bacterium]